MKVIVVGAGTAGLLVTRELIARGYDVVTLEKSATPGGRISGAERDGYIMDLGAQFFTNYYDTTFKVCRDAGLESELVDYHLRSAAFHDNRLYPLELSRDPRVLWRSRRYAPRGLRVQVGLARLMASLFRRRRDLAFPSPENAADLDRICLAEWAQGIGCPEVLEYFLQPAASSLSCAQPEDMSAANGLSLTWHIMSGVFKGFAAMDRGLGTLAGALARDCGNSIMTSTPARRIVIEDGAVKGVETDAGMMDADAVVCATTATTALRLAPGLPDSMRGPLEKVRYSACCHVMYGLENKLAPEGTYAVSIPRRSGSPIVSVGLDSAKSPHYAPPGRDVRGLYLCGEYMRVPGTVESAFRSGMAAVDALSGDCAS
ncbi:MAG TPA: FAD-dependent oxidoreductase [Candidatus Anoxymicrobiaceae bacterium]